MLQHWLSTVHFFCPAHPPPHIYPPLPRHSHHSLQENGKKRTPHCFSSRIDLAPNFFCVRAIKLRVQINAVEIMDESRERVEVEWERTQLIRRNTSGGRTLGFGLCFEGGVEVGGGGVEVGGGGVEVRAGGVDVGGGGM